MSLSKLALCLINETRKQVWHCVSLYADAVRNALYMKWNIPFATARQLHRRDSEQLALQNYKQNAQCRKILMLLRSTVYLYVCERAPSVLYNSLNYCVFATEQNKIENFKLYYFYIYRFIFWLTSILNVTCWILIRFFDRYFITFSVQIFVEIFKKTIKRESILLVVDFIIYFWFLTSLLLSFPHSFPTQYFSSPLLSNSSQSHISFLNQF